MVKFIIDFLIRNPKVMQALFDGLADLIDTILLFTIRYVVEYVKRIVKQFFKDLFGELEAAY